METPATSARPINEDTLKRLLYAVCNIGGNASPEEDFGIVYSESALAMAKRLFLTDQNVRSQMVESGYGGTQAQRDEFDPLTVPLDPEAVLGGAITAVKLWLECMEAPDPMAHAEAEIEKGLNGERVE